MAPRSRMPAGGATSRAGAASRIGGAICCPVPIVLALLGAAVAVPLLGRPDPAIHRIELQSDAFVTDIAFGVHGDQIFAGRRALGPTVVLLGGDRLWHGRTSGRVSGVTLAVDPVGGALIVATDRGRIQVLDPERLDPKLTMAGHRSRVQGMGVSADGTRLVSADGEGEIRLWDLAGGRLEREFRVAMGLSTCDLSPDGRTIVLGGRDGEIVAIGAADGVVIARREGHGSKAIILDLAFSPDGRTLASAGLDGTIRTWDVADGWAPRLTIADRGGLPRCLAIAPDGRSLASGHRDGRVRVRDLATGAMLYEKGVDGVQLSGVSFAPDGRRLAVASGSAVTVIDLIAPA